MAESTWAPTPAAKALATEQKLVAGYVGMSDDTEGLEQALAAIEEAVANINQRTWNWAVVYHDIPFDTTLVDYPLPGNFKRVQRFMILDESDNPVYRLPYKAWQTFLNERQESVAPGEPCVYTCANTHEYGTISLDVFPTADFVSKHPKGRLFYYRKVQYSTEEGRGDWPEEFTPYVRNYAKSIVAGTYAPAKVPFVIGLADRAWANLTRDDNLQQTDWE